MKKIKIGIVGCGAIGSSLSRAIFKNFSGKAELVALYDLDSLKSEALAKKLKRRHLALRSLESLIKRSGLVIEAASANASFKIAKMVLSDGKSVMIMSVGGIVKGFKALSRLAVRNNCRIYIPSGAISGIDALKAANIGKIRKVTLTTTKNPSGFKGVKYVQDKGIDLNRIKGEKVLFCGKAKDAVRYFPQNINVAAVLSLSGIGIANTKVRIIASPKALRNIHEIKIESAAGDISTRTENILHPDNPKTSYLAVLSAVATLKRILEPVVIGT
ncbi:MAG: aspartate dehydrogenase [Candidatus Omnitrophica bacterium]|nr:aspartate dehydrogenase [Candidatus Omnitrophota bacterium]MDD3987692.1 aspartate dehydrogenase [Candidatus Omnitrophota bacterium]MDD4982051.1 aspartate dehydrogenase [Candidatus Omnitrophota bacterium]MDD5665443.1 aspartate dehydrogenase [Candidatus Omnitrophota bacterium]